MNNIKYDQRTALLIFILYLIIISQSIVLAVICFDIHQSRKNEQFLSNELVQQHNIK